MFSFLLYSLLRIKRYNTYAWIMSCIQQGCRQRGAWGLQPPQFLTDQLTLSQPGGADYAHHSTISPPVFSDLATGLSGHICLYISKVLSQQMKLLRNPEIPLLPPLVKVHSRYFS